MNKKNKIEKIVVVACILLAVLLSHQVKSFADIPRMISYQGRLTDNNGAPVADKENGYSMTFKLCTDAACTSVVWSETKLVPVSNGLFSTRLGEVTLLDNIPFDSQYFLQPTVPDISTEPFSAQELSASAYSINADKLDGLHAIDFATALHNHDTTYVNVTGDSMTGALNVSVNSAEPAVKTTQSGTSSLFSGNHTGASGNLVQLQSDGTDKFVVDKNGVITTGSVNNAHMVDGKHDYDFASATHNHDADYVNVTGDTISGNLTVNGTVTANTFISSGGKQQIIHLEINSTNWTNTEVNVGPFIENSYSTSGMCHITVLLKGYWSGGGRYTNEGMLIAGVTSLTVGSGSYQADFRVDSSGILQYKLLGVDYVGATVFVWY